MTGPIKAYAAAFAVAYIASLSTVKKLRTLYKGDPSKINW